MKIRFTEESWNAYVEWQQQDRATWRRINQLIRDIQRDPNNGIGQPEALRHNLSGMWARRIDREHRLVYCIDDDVLAIFSCRNHY